MCQRGLRAPTRDVHDFPEAWRRFAHSGDGARFFTEDTPTGYSGACDQCPG